MALDLDRISDTIATTDSVRRIGRLRSVVGLAIEADLPGLRLGELVTIERRRLPGTQPPLLAEVVGFRDHAATLMPLGDADGLGPDDAVHPTGHGLVVPTGASLLGRVLDGLGRPVDGGAPLDGTTRPVHASAPGALERPPICEPLPVGVRALDAFATLGEGQRIGLFAASGAGKTSLLAQIARQAAADVVVVCLVGERGRELGEFLEDALGPEGRARSVVVCATSDAPPLVRKKSPYVATAIAEGFREEGRRVLLLVDSVTRFARAGREVGLAIGEPPTRRGYTPSVLAALPGLVERAGRTEQGSITGVYTVLVEGDDLDEPIADELRGVLDGHVVLSRALAERGHFPAVDVGKSLSRLMARVTAADHQAAAAGVRAHLAVHEAKRDLVALGAYAPGTDPALDAALERVDRIEAFLRQAPADHVVFEETLRDLRALV